MDIKRTQSMLGAVLVGAALAAAPAVQAGLILQLDDGTTTVTVEDGSALDMSPEMGVVTFMGTVGSWLTNVSTGLSKPLVGTATLPVLHFNSVDVSSSSGGDLTLRLTDTGFEAMGDITFISSVGGVTDGTVSFQTYMDDSDTAFGTGTLLADYGPFGGGAFAAQSATEVYADGSFSLTAVAQISHPDGGLNTTSFDAEISVPVPASLALLGIGLLGLGLGNRRRRA